MLLAKPSKEEQEEEEIEETTTQLVAIVPTEEELTTLSPDSGKMSYNVICTLFFLRYEFNSCLLTTMNEKCVDVLKKRMRI